MEVSKAPHPGSPRMLAYTVESGLCWLQHDAGAGVAEATAGVPTGKFTTPQTDVVGTHFLMWLVSAAARRWRCCRKRSSESAAWRSP